MSFGRGRIESGKMAPEIQASIQKSSSPHASICPRARQYLEKM
jgi:hypothetical protein